MKNINMIPAIPGTVGAIMSRQPLELSPRMRAREALARLRQVGVPQDFMSSCYVVDEEGRLLGALTLYELVAAPDCAVWIRPCPPLGLSLLRSMTRRRLCV